MADQREAVEMDIIAIANRSLVVERGGAAKSAAFRYASAAMREAQEQGSPSALSWAKETAERGGYCDAAIDEVAVDAARLARAVIALDEEVRRLRGEVDRNLNQFICVEHGLNVKCRDGMVCATCGRDVIIVMDGKILPESIRDVVDGEIEARRCDSTAPLCPECGGENSQIPGVLCYACAHKDDSPREAQPAPSSPGACEPSEAEAETVAHRLMMVWMEHVEARDADETVDGDGDIMIVAMSFDEALALAREAIRLGADPGRVR